MSRLRALFFTVLSATLVGCGGSGDTTTVEGNVTFEGKPVTSGLINFQAADGQIAGGGIQSDGTYSFELLPGEYQVRIDSPEEYAGREGQGASTAPVKPRQVPAEFASYESSGLTATISGDESTQQVDFNLP